MPRFKDVWTMGRDENKGMFGPRDVQAEPLMECQAIAGSNHLATLWEYSFSLPTFCLPIGGHLPLVVRGHAANPAVRGARIWRVDCFCDVGHMGCDR
jgi:hypothetical protein